MELPVQVVIASTNPVKLNAVEKGFSCFFEWVQVIGIEVESGVSQQPASNEETRLGAENRAKNARKKMPDADFWVGIEGGIECLENKYFAFAWVNIRSAKQNGESRTSTFYLPAKIVKYIKEGFELGVAMDKVFSQKNSKQKQGAVGILTKNEVSRTSLYKQAVELALIPFLNPELF